jgi:hypothetical protein
MKKLSVFSLRKSKLNKEEHIKLDCVNAIYSLSIKHLGVQRTIISEKAFPGDDTDFIRKVVEYEFQAEIHSNVLLEAIKKINVVSNPVIELTYDDRGLTNKLESIEYWQKSDDLIVLEDKLNIEFDIQESYDDSEFDNIIYGS